MTLFADILKDELPPPDERRSHVEKIQRELGWTPKITLRDVPQQVLNQIPDNPLKSDGVPRCCAQAQKIRGNAQRLARGRYGCISRSIRPLLYFTVGSSPAGLPWEHSSVATVGSCPQAVLTERILQAFSRRR